MTTKAPLAGLVSTFSTSILVLGIALAAPAAAQRASSPGVPDRSAPPKPGPMRPFTIVEPVEWKLQNGLRIWFLERKRAPLVDVVAVVDAGAEADPPELPGLASFTAGMLTEGAGDLDAIAFSDAEQALGASIAASAEPENADVALHVAAARFAEAMDLFTLALTRPRFDEREWKRVQQQTFGYYMYQSQDPQELVGLVGARANWGAGHRFGTSLVGTPRALLRAKTGDLRSFHAARYRPDTTTLVIVGDIDRRTLQKVLDKTVGLWAADGPAPPPLKLSGPQAVTRRTVLTMHVPGAPQTALRVQSPAPPDLLPWSADLDVMNTLLGGSFTSRLNTNLREEHGYSYGARSGFILFEAGNVFTVRTSVATPVTGPAAQEVLHELERIREPATEEEVVRARSLAALSLPSTFDSGRATAGLWANVAARKTDPKRLLRFMDEALKVDVAAVQAIARRVVAPDTCTFIAVGDMDAVGKDLDRLGPRTAVELDELLPGLQEAAAAFGQDGQEGPRGQDGEG
jgi:zinc protease